MEAQDQLAGTKRQHHREEDPQRAAEGRPAEDGGERAAEDERERGTAQGNEPAHRALRRNDGGGFDVEDRQEVAVPPALARRERCQDQGDP